MEAFIDIYWVFTNASTNNGAAWLCVSDNDTRILKLLFLKRKPRLARNQFHPELFQTSTSGLSPQAFRPRNSS
jgi:hypothetical protein